MNRLKKENKRKHDEARKGLSMDQIAAVDLEDSIKEKIEQLARKIHSEKFPEQYDCIGDSSHDAYLRSIGIDPMSQEYIERIRNKREELGIYQLVEKTGMSISGVTYKLCEAEAKKQICSDLSLKRPPAKTCVFCDKTIDEIGGKRLSAQQLRGVTLSDKYQGGGSDDFPYQSVELFNDSKIYVVVWGEKAKWTESAVAKAKNEYENGKRPWFCQICGERKCSQCGGPINYPMGSDILCGDGCSPHAGVFPFDPGCINPDCEKYKEWGVE